MSSPFMQLKSRPFWRTINSGGSVLVFVFFCIFHFLAGSSAGYVFASISFLSHSLGHNLTIVHAQPRLQREHAYLSVYLKSEPDKET